MARKPEITLKHYIHQEAGSLYEQGKALVEHYLPGWNLDYALTTLLHEIGHAKLHKRLFEFTLNPWRDYLEEFEAWVWAEETCKRLGIKFDYHYADEAIGFYRKRFKFRRSVQPMWRGTT